MSVVFIKSEAPSYQCLSTDITNGSATGISWIGADVFVTDLGTYYRTYSDGSHVLLAAKPQGSVSITGSQTVAWSGSPTVSIAGSALIAWSGSPTVSISGTPTVTLSGTSNTVVYPNPVINGSYVGQITISSSSVNTSGSTLTPTNAGGFLLKPHPNNSLTVWIINTGGTPSSGWPINIGDSDSYYSGSALSSLDFGITSAGSAVICFKKC